MDYENRYKAALERAKKLHKDAVTLQLEQDIKDYEYIFPKLKESDDEAIRKKLLSAFKSIMADADEDELWYGLPYNDIIAWLEKQGEQNPAIEMKTAEESLGIDSAAYNNIVDECIYGKPAWSEKDEINLQGVIDEIEANKRQAPDYDLATYDRFLSWFELLKERIKPQWKPSEEHISRLETAINYLDSIGAESSKIVLRNLLEQLKLKSYNYETD